MSDIIERLRDMADYRHMDRSQDEIDETMREAADEIERLEQSRDGYARDSQARQVESDRWKARAEAAEARLAEARAEALEAAAQLVELKLTSVLTTDTVVGRGLHRLDGEIIREIAAAIRALKSGGAK